MGHVVPGRFALATGGMSVASVVEAARQAEALGYEAVFVGEVGLEADAFVTAAAALQSTARLRCGPGIANVVDRTPTALARGAVTLDQLAPGRTHLGLGRGDRAAVPHADLGGILRTTRELLQTAERRIPLLLAAVGPRTLRLAAAAADGVLLNYGAPPEYIRWAVAQIHSAAEQAGRDPQAVDVYAYLFAVATDAPDAPRRLDRLSRELAELHAQPGQGRWLAAQVGAPARWDGDALRRFAVVGTREECLRRIEEYREAGVRCPVLMPSAMRALHGPVAMIQP